jgi:hypothetical protein
MPHDQTEPRHDDDTDDDVWCEVEVQKGSLVSVYRGRISRLALVGWQEGTLRGAVAINDVYWPWDDGCGNEGWVVVGGTPGPYAHGTGTLYVRADSILVVVTMRDGSEREAHLLSPHTQNIADA